MIPAALQGPLLMASFMAVVVVATGLPTGLFTAPRRGQTEQACCGGCGNPMHPGPCQPAGDR